MRNTRCFRDEAFAESRKHRVYLIHHAKGVIDSISFTHEKKNIYFLNSFLQLKSHVRYECMSFVTGIVKEKKKKCYLKRVLLKLCLTLNPGRQTAVSLFFLKLNKCLSVSVDILELNSREGIKPTTSSTIWIFILKLLSFNI